MTLTVVDSSTMVSALIEANPQGIWALDQVTSGTIAAPALIHVEVTHVLRRAANAGLVSNDVATLAHSDLVDLPIEVFPYEPFATRIWGLRGNVTPYDAWYVALAEALDAPLATLDRRLAAAPGPRCEFRTSPGSE